MDHTFGTFLCYHCKNKTWNFRQQCFKEDVNNVTTNFFSLFLNLGAVPWIFQQEIFLSLSIFFFLLLNLDCVVFTNSTTGKCTYTQRHISELEQFWQSFNKYKFLLIVVLSLHQTMQIFSFKIMCIQGCALRKIKGSPVLWTCKI